MSYIFLSHSLSEKTPGYGGKQGFFSTHTKDMCAGDSCNQMEWSLSNHIGTHMDAPFHFDKNGQTIDQLTPQELIFSKIGFLDIDLSNSSGELINLKNYSSKLNNFSSEVEFLIIKTHFEKNRETSLYWDKNPGISAESAEFLRNMFPQLRAIGFDFLSLTSYQHREEGRKSHRAFLSKEFGKPIWIVEDMSLVKINRAPLKMILAPLRVEKADGAQVTIFAEVSN